MHNDTQYLTGLRGYSALAVFFIHSGGGGLRELGKLGNMIVDAGKYGVISFFVLSAFTLSMSISNSSNFKYTKYLLRRFARIFPMYALVCCIFWALGGNTYYQDLLGVSAHSLKDLIYHLTFLNEFNYKYKTTIIGVE